MGHYWMFAFCLKEHDVSVNNGVPITNTSIIGYGQLFWRNGTFAGKLIPSALALPVLR
jgi:hypothetical protein